jgi:hypothetical protein
VLSLDWPGQVTEDSPYISIARELVHLDVAPAIGRVIDNWPEGLPKAIKLKRAGGAGGASLAASLLGSVPQANSTLSDSQTVANASD